MRALTFMLILLMQTSWLSAQDYASWKDIFEESYSLEKSGEYQKSLEILQDIYLQDSYDINIRYGWLYYLLGDYPNSKKYYKQAMNIMPYSLEAKFGYVLPVAGMGAWHEVIDIYTTMLSIDPKNTVVNYRLGAIYYNQQDYQKAYDYLEEVINLYPNDYDSNLLYAWTNLQMGKLKEAKVLFNKVLLIKPDCESATEGLGLIH